MQTKQISGRLTFTILSISLLTVMAGAVMAPALWAVKTHFADKPDLLIQFIVSLPALFIFVTNLCFPVQNYENKEYRYNWACPVHRFRHRCVLP